MMKKQYLSAPLPFQGQKRNFAREYIKVLSRFPADTTFVDLFGGSGLLSHIAKCQKPGSTVVYNDFDGYRTRLAHIPQTNALLAELRSIVRDYPKKIAITSTLRERVLSCIREYERTHGYVDYITLSGSLMFSMKYATCYEDLQRETLYNRVKAIDYPPADDYLSGLTVTSCDYRKLFEQYKDVPGVVFLVDPPYLSTDTTTYKTYWKLADYLDVLTVLDGHRFIYFTSDKSSILELCDWIGRNKVICNPFANCTKVEFRAHLNYNAAYTDIMLYKNSV
jgi:hypothetical protein